MQNNPNVIGKYRDPAEVRTTLQRLEREGYAREDISLYTNRENFGQFEDTMGMDMHTTDEVSSTRTDDDRSLWEEIKGMFTVDEDREVDHTVEDDFLTPYREDIRNGYTVIAVQNYRGDDVVDTDLSDADRTAGMTDEVTHTDNLSENEKIRLKEERLHVDKEEVQTGEVHVTKQTVHDTETVEVPVEREEVVIERKPVVDGEVDVTDSNFDEETESITIPVKEEQVIVDKDTVVTEEVEIKKEHEQDIEHVSEDVRREEIDVETSGDVHRTDTDLNDPTMDTNRTDLDNPELDDPNTTDRI